MLPGLAAAATAAHRCSWSSLCRLHLRCRAAGRSSSDRLGWQNLVTFGNFAYMVPYTRPCICALSQVKLYSTNVQKEGQGSQTPRVEKVPSFDETGNVNFLKSFFPVYWNNEPC
uniref:Uncharacterized protein n=1 Tax=Castor canadensis TaxID=51338 RepID=A0A8C0XI03_CASCN